MLDLKIEFVYKKQQNVVCWYYIFHHKLLYFKLCYWKIKVYMIKS